MLVHNSNIHQMTIRDITTMMGVARETRVILHREHWKDLRQTIINTKEIQTRMLEMLDIRCREVWSAR
jgi:hypothetical protein